MPMSADLMASEVITAIEKVADKKDRNAVFKAMCGAIIAHIQTNASITGPATGLAMTGPGTAVTGTIIVPPGSIK